MTKREREKVDLGVIDRIPIEKILAHLAKGGKTFIFCSTEMGGETHLVSSKDGIRKEPDITRALKLYRLEIEARE